MDYLSKCHTSRAIEMGTTQKASRDASNVMMYLKVICFNNSTNCLNVHMINMAPRVEMKVKI